MKYTTPLLLALAALTAANPVTSPSANAIASANPLVARDPICDKCNKEFEDCQKTWVCWINPRMCIITCHNDVCRNDAACREHCGWKCP